MAAQVGRDHMELPAQRVEGAEPVEPAARHEPVEQDEGRRPGRPGDLPDERGAPPREPDTAAQRHRRPDPSVLADDRPGHGVADDKPEQIRSRSLHVPPERHAPSPCSHEFPPGTDMQSHAES